MSRPRPRMLFAFGTRPEVIKVAPVVLALKRSGWADGRLLFTAQHRHLADDALAFFQLEPHDDLDAMRDGQTLSALHDRLLEGIDRVLVRERPQLVVVAGDTSTVLAAAIAATARRVPVAHIEAGLRTGDFAAPFPEELNRVLTTRLASLHFAPTTAARTALLAEGVPGDMIAVTGNPVIDALLIAARGRPRLDLPVPATRRLILVTAHRRESFGEPLAQICRAVEDLARRRRDVEILWPLHPNPEVAPRVRRLLSGTPRVRLCRPLGYGQFVAALQQSYCVLTDSGGVQEEAPALGKPVLVLREKTERPEAVAAGQARLIGARSEIVVREVERLLDDPQAYRAMQRSASPYGDGHAAARIERICRRFLGVDAAPTRHYAARRGSRLAPAGGVGEAARHL